MNFYKKILVGAKFSHNHFLEGGAKFGGKNSSNMVFYSINKNESILYTRKNLINNTNYFILIKHCKKHIKIIYFIFIK